MRPAVDPWGAARAFELPGPPESIASYGSGHINDTFLVTCRSAGRPANTVLQRINHEVFREPERLMENVERVTAHLAKKLVEEGAPGADRRALSLIPARDGRTWHRDGDGATWRVYRFIDGASSHDVVTTPGQAREAAKAFARFARLLADLPGPRLSETIPGFHDTRGRFRVFLDTLRTDPLGRAKEARETVDAYLARESLADALRAPLADGSLRERVTHNDTKVNNVLLDDATGEGVCVIDLDTVMPGLFLHDFGDLVRTAATSAAEDEPDVSKVGVDVGMFAALVRGASEGLGGELSAFERESLPLAGRVITFEVGMRFLTDFLLGDGYFKVHRPGHNLERSRAQLALLMSLEERQEELARAAEASGRDS